MSKLALCLLAAMSSSALAAEPRLKPSEVRAQIDRYAGQHVTVTGYLTPRTRDMMSSDQLYDSKQALDRWISADNRWIRAGKGEPPRAPCIALFGLRNDSENLDTRPRRVSVSGTVGLGGVLSICTPVYMDVDDTKPTNELGAVW